MLDSHCRLFSIDSDVHRQNEEYPHVPTKEPRVNKVDDLLINEVEHVLLLANFFSIDRCNVVFHCHFSSF